MVDPRIQGRWGTAQVSGVRAVGIRRYARADAPELVTLYDDTTKHLGGDSQKSVLGETLVPYIVSVTVINNGTDVRVTFSEPISTTAATALGWQMEKDGGGLEAVPSAGIGGNSITLRVPVAQSPLAAGDTCRIVFTDANAPLKGDRTDNQVPDQDITFTVALDVPITGPAFDSGFDGGFE